MCLCFSFTSYKQGEKTWHTCRRFYLPTPTPSLYFSLRHQTMLEKRNCYNALLLPLPLPRAIQYHYYIFFLVTCEVAPCGPGVATVVDWGTTVWGMAVWEMDVTGMWYGLPKYVGCPAWRTSYQKQINHLLQSSWSSYPNTITITPTITTTTTIINRSAIALTQLSEYIIHKNLAVHKIMEAMHTAHTKSGTVSIHLKLHMKQTITEQQAFGKDITFHWLNRLMNLMVKRFWNASFVSLFLFVDTHSQIFVRKFVHLRKVYASSQNLAQPLPDHHHDISCRHQFHQHHQLHNPFVSHLTGHDHWCATSGTYWNTSCGGVIHGLAGWNRGSFN